MYYNTLDLHLYAQILYGVVYRISIQGSEDAQTIYVNDNNKNVYKRFWKFGCAIDYDAN